MPEVDATGEEQITVNFVIAKVVSIGPNPWYMSDACMPVIALLHGDEHGCYGVRCWDFNENREEIFMCNVFLTWRNLGYL